MTRPFRLLLPAILAGTAIAAPAYADRPYTVDDMLALEQIGAARFDPSGERLIFERYDPFERQSAFGRQFVIGEHRSKIYAVDLRRDAAPAPLFAQDAGSGYTITSMSPDGAWLAISRASDKGLTTGVVPVAGGDATMFDFSPVLNPVQATPWSAGGLILPAGPAGEVDMGAALGTERVEAVSALWRQRNRGEKPTASRLGSGRFAALPERKGGLVFAEPGHAGARTIAGGRFSIWYPSADGALLAALREERLEIDPDKRIEHGANIGAIQRRLLIFDPRGDAKRAPIEPCRGCDILSSSLNWSAAAPLLSFVARDEGTEWSAARIRVFDARTGASSPVALGTLKPHADRSGIEMNIATTWLGTSLVVRAEQPGAADAPVNARGDARADWYLIGAGAPRNLTAGFAGETPQLVGLGRDSLILLHDGDAWRVDAAGNRRNLTADIAERVTAWRAPSPYGYRAVENRQPESIIILQIASERADSPDRLVFVDPASGRTDTLAAPSSESEFVAVAPAMRRAALLERTGNVTRLMVIDAAGARRDLAELNTHLKGVVGGTPVRIDHKGPGGDARMSWILLPPGYKPGHPVPTVVNVYPGSIGRETWTRWELDRFHALNDHILAARGYAILYPSVPVRYEKVPRDPLEGLPAEVFAAVDAAIAKGYVDGARMAVQGQSYGGYTTGALVGLTDRFRSAVAQAGLYDLVSSYGQFDIRRRLDIEKTGLDLFAASLMETSQGGMGAPPWDDPERYLRNSPLMHVKAVKTPIMLLTGDLDYVSTTQTEEFFTALTRLNKDAVMVRYFGEDHVFNSPANIRDMWRRILEWYDATLAPAETK